MSMIKKITLRTALVLPTVMILIITFGVIVFVQQNSYEKMVNDISTKQLTSLTANVNKSLFTFLHEPFNASLALSHNIGFNQLYQPNNIEPLQSYMHAAFSNLYRNIPQLDALGFGSTRLEHITYRKEANNGYTLILQDERTDRNLVVYRGSKISQDIRSIISNYDSRTRPWYTPVAKSKKPIWSSIYANADERQEITLSALTPVFTDDAFQGVFVADIKINTFNKFLQNLKEKHSASFYIFDQDQRLVAHSSNGSVVSWGTPTTDKGHRLLATESSNPIIKISSSYINENKLDLNSGTQRFQFNVDGERYFSQTTPFKDEYGLTWFISTSISESALLGDLPQDQKNSWLMGVIVGLFGIGITILALNRITKPITSTADSAKQLAKGDWDSTMPQPGYIYETSMLVSAFNEMSNNLRASFKALRDQILIDPLTKLYSRDGLIETSSAFEATSGFLLLIGIDRFRDINESLGHHKGDQLLVMIAERLNAVSEYDYIIARPGGDEFAIYLPNATQQEEVTLFAHTILQIFNSAFVLQSENVVINASIGIVETSSNQNMMLWLRNGSIALSLAKKDITHITIYSPEMADVSRNRTKMMAKIQSGLANDEFVPFYQPIIDLATGNVIGAEALARWITSDNEIISPIDFIPLAEDTGLIEGIGQQILEKTCHDTAHAIRTGKWPINFQIHVNVSVNQLSKPTYIDDVKRILHETGLSESNLTLEITESRIADSDPMVMQNMRTLKEMGIGIAIDDFGTGYSSLAYLHKLPFSCLKIDRAFIKKLDSKNLDSSIVAAIVNITKGFKVNLVAEGVETVQQAELLAQLHCPQVQGFLYSKPVPLNEWPTDLVNMN
ncbi:EAL domain-containing protein [Vibrio clamense]|uniref:bifunctional diguanylate cyclase/phosphodiesterase n=1 Tax=Vibrio clamense TaxID=2910254 RepID=UPI003D1FD4F7